MASAVRPGLALAAAENVEVRAKTLGQPLIALDELDN
jgi:hypothetical protein